MSRFDIRSRTGYRLAILVLLLCLLFAALLLAIRFGSSGFTFRQILRALFIDTTSVDHRILMMVRMPRAIAAALVGFCLALSGTLLQGVMRNPLASPNVIGVSAGAGLAAVCIYILFPGHYFLVTPVAFGGAFLAALLVYLLAWKGGASPLRLVLSGIAVSSFLGAGSNALMIFFPDRVQHVIGFMVGNLSAVTWQQVRILWPYAFIGFLFSMLLADRLNILLLGDETANSLGLNVEASRMFFMLIASLLAASAVSIVGLLGFVGLIVPHVARLVIGNNARYLIPASALLGAVVVLLCDTLGRVILRPQELPVGIIMAMLGAPFFLYLLRQKGEKMGGGHGH
ncbi:FecCD family ABC transporter permease [Sediminispirochaeta smaragdinae]|uniref:Transport system permease protein n=1 Tax=Sediminispirochaeta smaragdinae (strain DSM 11293 / JCM 15392 / SEBR 4228) TaxID=573413 RepID=E1R8J4_SEDSS|nr:iron ABC transporter permease [Sediminispirochaeta smaragdinae]ADK79338.1 transport system permease protein [Sediminispirochaeta smaragdinae DSM 11293]